MTPAPKKDAPDLSNQSAIVFGASRGIGLATARTLAAAGAKVTLAARSRDTVRAEADALTQAGHTAIGLACDVTDWASVQSAVEAATTAHGAPDIIVNNAGTIEPLAHLADSDPALWAQAVAVNLLGTYHGMRAVLPAMRARNSGTVVNISSGAANSDLPGWSHYCATKAGARKLTEVAARELREGGHDGVTVVGLSPGTVATDMMATIRDSKINVVSNLPWDRHIPPEWVGHAVAHLCGPLGAEHRGRDFSLKTEEGRAAIGLPPL